MANAKPLLLLLLQALLARMQPAEIILAKRTPNFFFHGDDGHKHCTTKTDIKVSKHTSICVDVILPLLLPYVVGAVY